MGLDMAQRSSLGSLAGGLGVVPGKSLVEGLCRCQNRRISGRGSQTVRLGRMVTGDEGHDVFTQVRALSMEVKPYVLLD